LIAAQPSREPVLELDGYAWRRALPEDAATLDQLAAHGSNRVLFNLPSSADEFTARVGGAGLRLPMLCAYEGEFIGAGAFAARSNRDLNAILVSFFVEPSTATQALAMYVRHLFWSWPFHRLYAQLPLVDGGAGYLALLTAIGFVEEGVVPEHALIAGRPCDVAVLGILRREVEAWCQANESRLAL